MEVSVVSASTSDVNVVWVHNTPREGRMFLWDLLDAFSFRVRVDAMQMPLRPNIMSVRDFIYSLRKHARSADLVHAQFGSLVGLVASFGRSSFVLSLRGTDFYVLPTRTVLRSIEARVRQFFTLVACWRADLVIVMSERMKRELRRWPFLKNKRIIVIVDPVGTEFLTDDRERRAALDFQVSRPFNIFIGSLAPDNPIKRTWLIQGAVDICRRAGLPVNLRVVSGVPRDQVREAMMQSDLMALTSTHEGWPNVIKEGLALGLPFIATDVSDLADHCHAGSTNRIVEPNELAIALSIVDAIAQRDIGGSRASILPSVVAKKHEVVYAFMANAL